MAKVMLIFLSVFVCLLSCFKQDDICFADGTKQYYAKVQSNEVYFYTQPSDIGEFQLFKIPISYFVLLTADANDKFYSCRYGDKVGYVKKDEVTPMNGTPLSPYANFASFRVFALDGIDMRSTPRKTPLNVVTRIGYLEDNLVYYGSIEGDELVPNKSTTWYYCKYINGETQTFGYLSSNFCDQLTNIPLNMEEFEIVEGVLFPLPETPLAPATHLSGTVKTLIIVGVSLPCVVVLYLLIKPTLISEKGGKKTSKQKRIKRKPHGDYFEFDESDLT